MPNRKRRARNTRRRSNAAPALYMPTAYTPPAEPPRIPETWQIRRRIRLQFPLLAEALPISVPVTLIASALPISGVQSISILSAELRGGNDGNDWRLTHAPSGVTVGDSGTLGATRAVVGIRLPAHLTGPYPAGATTVIWQFQLHAKPGSVGPSEAALLDVTVDAVTAIRSPTYTC